MPHWLLVVLAVAGALLLLWIALVAVLWVQARRAGTTVDWRSAARLVPDVVRLTRRLVADRSVAASTRWILAGLLGYLLLPIDLIPDFLPVLGFADDAIIAALVLRYAIRRAGRPAIERHWPGTDAGLAGLLALLRVGG